VRAYSASGHWQSTTIYTLVRQQASSDAHRVAVREWARETTYAELLQAADRLAATLAAAGLAPGDRVAIWLPSRAETVAAVLACTRNGYVATPSLHRDHTVAEIVELVGRVRARALVAQVGYGADADKHDIESAVSGLDHLTYVKMLAPAGPGLPFADLEEEQAQLDVASDANSIAYLAFTSGTSGVAKGVMHSHNTLLAPVRALAADWALDRSSVIYTLSPLSHNLGFGAMLLAMSLGAELVVHDVPRGESLSRRLRETGSTFAFGVPTHAIDLLAELHASGDRLPDLRGFRISGAAVPPSVAQGLLDVGVMPQSGYGMTEAGSHHYTLPGDAPEKIVGTSGRACSGFELRIFDSEHTDRELAAGEVGQIGSRGASLMLGYFDDQVATESSFNRGGWFLTGDIGWADDEGYLRITGRKKDVIIRGGHNIYPAKIENLALRHSRIARAAAVPVPDPRLGERVCLVVEARGEDPIRATEMVDFLSDAGLSKYDLPEHFAQIPAMPLLPSGKVFKRRLLEQIAADEIRPSLVRAQERT
jgi:acyl-CoA synthetase (AMP-forming)/AMP-acid ligase II